MAERFFEQWLEQQQIERNRRADFVAHVGALTGHVNRVIADGYIETGDSTLGGALWKTYLDAKLDEDRQHWEFRERQKRERENREFNQRMSELNLAPWLPTQPLTGQLMVEDWRASRTRRSFKPSPSPMTREQRLEEEYLQDPFTVKKREQRLKIYSDELTRAELTSISRQLTESAARRHELEQQINQVKEKLAGELNIFKKWWYRGILHHILEGKLLNLEEEQARFERDKERYEKRLGIS